MIVCVLTIHIHLLPSSHQVPCLPTYRVLQHMQFYLNQEKVMSTSSLFKLFAKVLYTCTCVDEWGIY
jgi:hypothetical protein